MDLKKEDIYNQPTPTPPNSAFNMWMPFLLAIMLAGGIWIGFNLQPSMANPHALNVTIQENGKPMQVSKVEEVLRFIDARYLTEPDRETLEREAIKGILKHLDPHSAFISLDDVERVNESLQGSLQGIGVEFFVQNDTVLIVGVLPEGPADKAGVHVGDRILSVNDSLIAGKTLLAEGATQLLKGEAGSTVKLDILRQGQKKPIKITRAEIPIQSVDLAYMVHQDIGYIKINRFSGRTHKEFSQALRRLKDAGLRHLILDLRQNPGGYLEQATKILHEFFPDEQLLVYTEGRSYSRKDYESKGRNKPLMEKITLLVDEGSASASEIMAGAIQDHDRGLIIGRRTFGKGLVQEQYELSDGSALRLTVARYYTPSGRLIQKSYNKGREAYNDEVQHRLDNGELLFKDSIPILDSTDYRTDNGRLVYGGGGIIPDIFVPADTLQYNVLLGQLAELIPSYSYSKLDGFLEKHKAIKDVETFIQRFSVSEAQLQDFLQFAAQKDRSIEPSLLAQVRPLLRTRIKAQFAQLLFREEGFYRVLHAEDEMLDEAIQRTRKKLTAEELMQ